MRYSTALLSALLAAHSPVVFAGSGPALKSSYATVYLNATVNERLSVVSAAPSVSFSLEPQSITRADEPLSITTSWNLDANRTAVVVSAFFSDPASALSNQEGTAGMARISSSEVFGRAATGTARSFASFATTRGGNGGLEIFHQPLTPHVNDLDSRTDILELQVDLRGHAKLAAGRYQGVLTLVAQAY